MNEKMGFRALLGSLTLAVIFFTSLRMSQSAIPLNLSFFNVSVGPASGLNRLFIPLLSDACLLRLQQLPSRHPSRDPTISLRLILRDGASEPEFLGFDTTRASMFSMSRLQREE